MNEALPPMTAERAIYFLERFKREEKLLGPNEQLALDFAIAALTPEPVGAVKVNDHLFDDEAPMADGGEERMTAAEDVLAWLIIEKIGAPDDVSYSPKQAQEIIARNLDLIRELWQIDDMLDEGQGDDQGPPIMPEFTKGMSTYAKVEACLHLLEKRRDALETRPTPSSLKERVEGLTEALQFYANELNWSDAKFEHDDSEGLNSLTLIPSTIDADRGERARAALQTKAGDGE